MLSRLPCWFLLALAACGRPTPAPALPLYFPDSFQFGFATVAYQSEGTTALDGGVVESNWSQWEDLGKIVDGQKNSHGNGFRDHSAEELDRAVGLGATSFSYALDWARIEPAPGVFDEAETARAVALVKAMRDRNLRPLIVLFHWVSPAWVASPKSGVDLLAQPGTAFADAFLPFVDHMVPLLADRVDDWVTFEEPWSIIGSQYLTGDHPPGKILAIHDSQEALVNLAYFHARVYKRVKTLDQADADGDGVPSMVGVENLAFDTQPLNPDSADDQKAADHYDYALNHHFLHAVWNGDLDVDLDGRATNTRSDPPERHDPALEHNLDFIGINYYQRVRVEGGALKDVAPFYGLPHGDVREYDAQAPHSDMYQEIAASGLRRAIEEYKQYGLPMVVSENGLADADDDQRPFFLLEHLRTVAQALADGYDVRGYYAWTLSDNFEWNTGYTSRFGLYAVDFTQPSFPRTRRPSADVYEAIARGRQITDDLWNRYALPAYPVGIP